MSLKELKDYAGSLANHAPYCGHECQGCGKAYRGRHSKGCVAMKLRRHLARVEQVVAELRSLASDFDEENKEGPMGLPADFLRAQADALESKGVLEI
jgi:hypothetical protein